MVGAYGNCIRISRRVVYQWIQVFLVLTCVLFLVIPSNVMAAESGITSPADRQSDLVSQILDFFTGLFRGIPSSLPVNDSAVPVPLKGGNTPEVTARPSHTAGTAPVGTAVPATAVQVRKPPSLNRTNTGRNPEIQRDKVAWSARRETLSAYLAQRPRIRAQMGFEVDHLAGVTSGSWLYYDNWPPAWKDRLVDFYTAYDLDTSLPMESPLPLAPATVSSDTSKLAYRSADLARDVYFAQVAYSLWLDSTNSLPWHLEDWSDDELSNILSSKVLFYVERVPSANNGLYYFTLLRPSTDLSENIHGDPRIAFRFMEEEPEQGKRLIGATPSETGMRLTEWFQTYLHHNSVPQYFDPGAFYRAHPLVEDRLQRYDVPLIGHVYVTPGGCGSAGSLFADLMRSVNIPVRLVTNELTGPDGVPENHVGLLFDWQGGGDTSRYLFHTDDIYYTRTFFDPAPAPEGTTRGEALWNHVWLNPGDFGRAFTYIGKTSPFARGTHDQVMRYQTLNKWSMAAASVLFDPRSVTQAQLSRQLIDQDGLSGEEAGQCIGAYEASLKSYGGGDVVLGYQRLMVGTDSRHGQWCNLSGKCHA